MNAMSDRPGLEEMLLGALEWLRNVDRKDRELYLSCMPNDMLGVSAMLERLADLRERDELVPDSATWRLFFRDDGYDGCTCDWGHCNAPAVTLRNTYDPVHGWLPVCEAHRLTTERALHEASWAPPTLHDVAPEPV